MKMVKSLLLGSAAGLVAVTAGQAADLPVKARPVQYVKVCSLYGAGFYYMPGTDMCMKIGGWVRSEVTYGINGSSTTGIFNTDYNNRNTNNLWTRERGYITADAREQTAYGVARGYIDVGISIEQQRRRSAWLERLQLEPRLRAVGRLHGRPVGVVLRLLSGGRAAVPRRQHAERRYRRRRLVGVGLYRPVRRWFLRHVVGRRAARPRSSASAARQRRSWRRVGASRPAPTRRHYAGAARQRRRRYGGWQSPDIVGNLRVDQAWGSAQVMGALHQVNAALLRRRRRPSTGGIPANKWGWVVGGGIKINAPFISPGDYFITEVNYTQGALKYLWNATGRQTRGRQWGNRRLWRLQPTASTAARLRPAPRRVAS